MLSYDKDLFPIQHINCQIKVKKKKKQDLGLRALELKKKNQSKAHRNVIEIL